MKKRKAAALMACSSSITARHRSITSLMYYAGVVFSLMRDFFCVHVSTAYAVFGGFGQTFTRSKSSVRSHESILNETFTAIPAPIKESKKVR